MDEERGFWSDRSRPGRHGPDAETPGQWTLSGEGNDPRRYVWPAPWVPWAMVLVPAAIVVLMVLIL